MDNRQTRLAGEVAPEKEVQQMAGESNVVNINHRLAGTAAPVSTHQLAGTETSVSTPTSAALLGPLGDPAVIGKTVSRGLKISAARKRNLYDNRPPIVGMRTMFSVDFYDIETRQPVSPANVRVVATSKSGNTDTITMVENSGRIGHYSGSFIADEAGEWTAGLLFSASEFVDSIRFYVVAS